MIKNPKVLEEFEKKLAKEEKLSLDEKFKIYDDMWKWAKKINRSENPLEGIETRITIARILNGIKNV